MLSEIYSEPTTLWRLRHPDGRDAHGVIVPRWKDASAVWFIDAKPEAAKDFENWGTAVDWLREVKTLLVTLGWMTGE